MKKEDIIQAIKEMTVLELNELVMACEEEFGVSASAPVAAAGAVEVEAVEEQSEFDVIMTSFGAAKIGVIKVVRAMTGLGLKEAKELVESAPAAIKEGVDKAEAEKVKKELEDAGASVELK